MLSEIMKKAVNLGFGAMLVTKENANELIEEMVRKGEIQKDETLAQVKEILKKILPSKEEIETRTEELVEKILHKLDIPTRHELQEMQKKLEAILKELDIKEKK
ncbi:poly(Hydroxyalcanoate) granule associated protein (Phasin) [Candidatus Kuenenia stuttgartiensis]|jgi:polyhydroxyalkanoate synthesis regulator phasin|uniref:Poly(Hydroxyalcanoate) granule associated protein (Phasin) n=1 Tax=Kuenenia stuttgartiensis TaxID=174633 RepID=Q1Q4I8_KUEST|nr:MULTISPECIES: phasin family protein [Kuenenia]MBW7942745.1 phasin family protein [Candidatus Kuenenia stuttgartiensis]MBZ0190549.1 phasin family protein [Candidatus Kuenenia stuttgartiensis]MCL4727676.1 phasin family protein [Candidatus Kuenenia stuttgartiensis]MCZ7621245.1 phasin family protein [Candidatus Kuenenia sp.]QII12684.1 poly(Hydroxyalcanoate) granule associated protein (Phasin) [Candidatus Kuenenia stuttgartiensis]